MNNENNPKSKKNLALKIIMPVLLISAVAGLWAVKNNQKNAGIIETGKESILETQNFGASSTENPEGIQSQNPEATPTDEQNNVVSETSGIPPADKPIDAKSQPTSVTPTNKSGVVMSQNPDAVPTNKPSAAASKNPNPTSANKSSTIKPDDPNFELHVTEKIDLEKLKSYGLPIVIDFGADSCIPCKQMAPVLKELNAELKGKAIVRFVDVWKYRELAEGYPISLIPTQIFFDANGKPYNPEDLEAKQLRQYTSKASGELVFTTHEGGMTKEQLLNVLNEMGMK